MGYSEFYSAANADDGHRIPTPDYVNANTSVWWGPAASYLGSWLRFQNVTIPAGATITAAYLRLYGAATVAAGTGSCDIYCVDDDDAAQLPNDSGEAFDALVLTTAKTNWPATAVTNVTFQSSPDISSAVQEVVDRPGWVSGNHLAVVVKDVDLSNTKRFSSYDSNSGRPRLCVEWTISGQTDAVFYPTAGADDGYGTETLETFINDTYILFGYAAYPRWGFCRFRNITVPPGATIHRAFLKLACTNAQTAYVDINVDVVASITPAVPTSYSELAALTLTESPVVWHLGEEGSWIKAQEKYISCDIASLIQASTDRSGWASGNNILVSLRYKAGAGANERYADSYEGTDPELHITYSAPETFDKSSSDSLAITGVTSVAYLTLLDNNSLDDLAITGITTKEYLYNVTGSDSLAITGITTKEYDDPIYEKISSDSLAITGITTTEYLYNVISSDDLVITGITTKEYDDPIYEVSAPDSLLIAEITTKEYDDPIYEKISSDLLAITGVTTKEYFVLHDVTGSDSLAITGITTKEYDDPIYEVTGSDDLVIADITAKEYDGPIYEKISPDSLAITGITTAEYLLTYEVSSYDELIINEVTINDIEIEQLGVVLYVKDIQAGQDIPVDGIVDHHGNYVQSLSFLHTPLDLDKVGDDIDTVTGSWISSVIDVTRKSGVLSNLLFSNPSASALFRFILYDFNGVELITDIITGTPTPVDQDGLYVSEYQVVISYGAKEAAIIIEDVSIGSVDVYLTAI